MSSYEEIGYRFVITELDLGITFARLALDPHSARNYEIKLKNKAYAQRACANALRFRKQLRLGDSAALEFESRLKELETYIAAIEVKPSNGGGGG